MKSIKIRAVDLGSVLSTCRFCLKTRCTLLTHGSLSLIKICLHKTPSQTSELLFATNALNMISWRGNNVTVHQWGIPTYSDRTNLQNQYCRPIAFDTRLSSSPLIS